MFFNNQRKVLYKQNIVSSIDMINKDPSDIVNHLMCSSNTENPTIVIYSYLSLFCRMVKQSQQVDNTDKGIIVSEMLKDTDIVKDCYLNYLTVAKLVASEGRDIAVVPIDVFIDIAQEIIDEEWS